MDIVGQTVLLVAINTNDVNMVKTCLDNFHNADVRPDIWHFLKKAIVNKQYEILDLLLSYTSSINSYYKVIDDNYTVLHLAIMHGSKEIVEFLLSRGADVSLASLQLGRTPLHFAAEFDKPSLIDLLINSGSDINATDKQGKTVLDVILSPRIDRLEILKILIGWGCDINSIGIDGDSFLMKCLHCRNLKLAEYLLKEKIGTRIKRNLNGDTLLHMAVFCNNDDIIRMILNLGVDINAVNNNGFTPFYTACQYRLYNSIESLLKYNCNVTIVEEYKIKQFSHHYLVTFHKQAIKLSALNREEGVRNFQYIKNFPVNALNREEDVRIFQYIEDDPVPEFDKQIYWNSCTSEMKKMDAIKIGDTNVTLLDVLRKNINQISKLFNNDAIRQFSLNQEDLATFPIYNNMIDYLFTAGRIRCTLIQKCSELCIANSSLSVLSIESIENILYYLQNVDLFVLVDSFELCNKS